MPRHYSVNPNVVTRSYTIYTKRYKKMNYGNSKGMFTYGEWVKHVLRLDEILKSWFGSNA